MPEALLPPQKHTYTLYGGESLKQMLDAIGSADPASVHMDYGHGYYDAIEIDLKWTDPVGLPNLTYAKQLKKYELEMAEYNEDMAIYDTKLIAFNALNKQYQKWFHEKELKKLEEEDDE